MSLKTWIMKKIVERKGSPMLDKVIAKVSGLKTYITSIIAILVLVIGRYWGPINVGPIDIPAIEAAAMWKGIWAAVTACFMRAGVKKSGPHPQPE